jgi:hypothetical protein
MAAYVVGQILGVYDLADLAGEDRAFCLDLVRDLLDSAGA